VVGRGTTCHHRSVVDRHRGQHPDQGRKGVHQRGLVIMVPILSKQRNRGIIIVLCHDMSRARKSTCKWGDLSSRMSSRDPVIRIFDLGPSRGVTMLPRWHVGNGFRHFGQFRMFNGSGGGEPRKSKRADLSSRMSSRDPVIRIFDLGPSRGVTMLPIGSATAVFGRLAWFQPEPGARGAVTMHFPT
jgi:hypothetical protein